MAAIRNQKVLKHTIHLFSSRSGKEGIAGGCSTASAGPSSDELDESDVIWASSFSPPQSAGPWPTRKKTVSVDPAGPNAIGSLPVNIPTWSKIQSRVFEEEDDVEAVLPPHEVLWRRRAESLSVVEGIGRTLKGRDLSRVRNAVWAQTGFQD
ncbi:uncharacterized protein LOC110109960 [Dendrobium catenatum]|uniref:Senescence regulator S40 n=1 Tax=Dendrobium catenatum TaxID=906689 RepID=A0A2I0V9P0_9ASPA|nr:uncharacterized protein LOC110109960 [Dendrobium catenatum]PKU60131.1 hypothetical protein MA16_Dca025374 [Dendrobium catenatum]